MVQYNTKARKAQHYNFNNQKPLKHKFHFRPVDKSPAKRSFRRRKALFPVKRVEKRFDLGMRQSRKNSISDFYNKCCFVQYSYKQ